MKGRKGLVLDANILIRAVFGQRVRQILEAYENVASFCSPDVCFQDVRKYIPDLSERRGFDPAVGLSVLEGIGRMVEPVDRSLYESIVLLLLRCAQSTLQAPDYFGRVKSESTIPGNAGKSGAPER